MSNTNFVDQTTVIEADWLNDANDHVYNVTTTDVHPASSITNTPAGTIVATDVQSAINEVAGEAAAAQSTADNHIADTTAAHAASAIANTPAGNIAATDVQTALNELDTEKATGSQVQSGTFVNIAAALTGTEYAATPAPAITAYAAGQRFMVTFDLACPAAPTLKLNGIATPPNLVRQNVDGTFSNLALNDFPAGWVSPVKLVSTTQALVENLPAETGSFTLTASGFTGSVTGTASYIKTGRSILLRLPTLQGTSNSTSFTASGVPTLIRPSIASVAIGLALDNSATGAISQAVINTDGTITFRLGAVDVGTTWTASGTKRWYAGALITYDL